MAAAESLTGLLHHLRRRCGDGPTDGDLLAEFAVHRDEAAFAELVGRHGGLVFGVARRHLADRQAAEDVVQATFASLSRSAARLGRPPSLVNWLYTVALRQARSARRRMLRQSALIARLPNREPGRDPLAEVSGRELVTIIDDELTRLPTTYRLPLLLCALEGLSREEAARRLGWPIGSVKGRLERGRELLRTRLAKRGLTVPAVLVGRLLTTPSEALPAALVAAVTRAAVTVPSGGIMARTAMAVLTVAGLGVGIGAAVWPGPRPDGPNVRLAPPPVAVAATEPRTDILGDPLPVGAVARLGSQRFFHGEQSIVDALAVSPDGRLIAMNACGGVRVWDAASGKEMPVPAAAKSARVFATRERLFAADSQDGLLRLWDLATGREMGPVHGLPRIGGRFAVSPDGTTLVYADIHPLTNPPTADHVRIRALTGAVEAPTFDLTPPASPVYQFAFSADGKTIAATCLDISVHVWDVPSRTEVAAVQLPVQKSVLDLALSPDGRTVAVGTEKGLHLFEARGGRPLPDLHDLPARRVAALSFSPDGRTLALACDEIGLWDLASRRQTHRLRNSGTAYHTAFSPDGRTVATVDSCAVTRWDVASGRRTPDLGHTGAVWTVAFTPDGNTLLTSAFYGDSDARAWNPLTGRQSGRWMGHEIGVTGLATSPDGRWAVTGSQDGTIRVWDVATGRETRRVADEAGSITSVCLSADGTTVAAIVNQRAVRLWNVTSGRTLRTLEPAGSYCSKIAFLPGDGSLLVLTTGGQSSVEFLSPVNWEVTRRIPVGSQATSLGVARDGRRLVTGGSDGDVAVWDAVTGGAIRQFTAPGPVSLKQSAGAHALALSPDGRCVAAGYGDNAVRVWELASGKVRARFDGHRGAVVAVAYSPDGALLASGSGDRTALVWDVAGRQLPGPPAVGTNSALAAQWEDLGDADATKAFQAIRMLGAAGDRGTRLIAGRLRPAIAADTVTTARHIADLDSDRFAVRERAVAALTGLGPSAEPALAAVLAGKLSVEARRRVELLLARLDAGTPETLRALRAVEVLEQIATPAAREHLKALAGGAAGTTLTRAAADALSRLPK